MQYSVFGYVYLSLFICSNLSSMESLAIFGNNGFRDQVLNYQKEKSKYKIDAVGQEDIVKELTRILDELSLSEPLIEISKPQRNFFSHYGFYNKKDLNESKLNSRNIFRKKLEDERSFLNLKILNVDKERDIKFIKDAFTGKDLYLMGPISLSDIDFMIDTMTSPSYKSNPKLYSKGKYNIKILFYKGEQVGFVTYMNEGPNKGAIEFLYIHAKYRGRGFSKELIRYAINDLFKNPIINQVLISTRIENSTVIELVKKFGFKEIKRDKKFVEFQLKRLK